MPWIDRLERELDNLRAALAFARDTQRDTFVQLAGALVSLWWLPAIHIKEGREWLADAVKEREGRPTDVARAVVAASTVASWQADPASAFALAREALERWQALGDDIGESLAYEAVGWSQMMGGDDAAGLTSMKACLRSSSAPAMNDCRCALI